MSTLEEKVKVLFAEHKALRDKIDHIDAEERRVNELKADRRQCEYALKANESKWMQLLKSGGMVESERSVSGFSFGGQRI